MSSKEKKPMEGCEYSFDTELCKLPCLSLGDSSLTKGPKCPPPCPEICVSPAQTDPVVKCIAGKVPPGAPVNDCDWSIQCVPSTPPRIPCAPSNVGYGQWDGGVMNWSLNCLDECQEYLLGTIYPNLHQYKPNNWEHILNLSTNGDYGTQLSVIRGHMPGSIRPMEFMALAVKLVRIGVAAGAVPELGYNPTKAGIGYVMTGHDDAGRPCFGLAQTYCGTAVGHVFPVVAAWNADNTAILSVSLPVPELDTMPETS